MIFLAYTGPTPGSASRSAWLAELRSTGAGLVSGLVTGLSAAGLVAAGLSAGFCAWPSAGANSSAAASETPRRRRPRALRAGKVGMSVTTIARAANFNRAGRRNEIFMERRCRRSQSIQRLDRLDDLGGVALDADLGPVLRDLAVLADEHGRPDDPLHLLAVENLVAPRAVGLEDLAVGVAEQRECELVLVAELAVRGDRVLASAQHDGAELGDRGQRGVEVVGLDGTARGVVARIEVEHDDLAGEIGELDLAA